MTGGELAIVVVGRREDWPGGENSLTPREPTRESNGTLWFGAEFEPEGQVWFRIAQEAIRRRPEKTPADRGRRLIDALIVWITPSPPEPGINRFEVRVSGGWRHMARTVCGREDRANRSPAWTRRERCGRPRPRRTRHRAPRAGRGCGRMRQVGVHHHDPVKPVACDTLEDATVQIGPGPWAHLDVHGQGPTSRAETTGVSSSESSSTSSSSHAMARPAMAPATRSAKQLEARGLSQRCVRYP